jgi:hypothetical protein
LTTIERRSVVDQMPTTWFESSSCEIGICSATEWTL